MSLNASDYQAFGRSCPIVAQTAITAMADTGAQSCLWSMTGFLAAGFTTSDRIPVSLDLVAANESPIKIAGAIILRLQGHSPDSEPFSCAPPWSTSVRPREASTCQRHTPQNCGSITSEYTLQTGDITNRTAISLGKKST